MALSPIFLDAIHKAKAKDDLPVELPAAPHRLSHLWRKSSAACAARIEENAEMQRVLPRDLIELELRRAPHRWAGYRFMSPLECTRQFAEDYRPLFRITFHVACDFEPEIGTPAFETLWRMRLAADACSMSYPMYLHIAFQICRRREPGPFRTPHMIFAKWQEQKRWSQYAKRVEAGAVREPRPEDLPQYHRQNYYGLPAQRTFRRKVVTGAPSKGWGNTASRYIFDHPVMTPKELVADLKGPERADAIAAVKARRATPMQSVELEPATILQTCFAWPRSRGVIDTCKTCPQERACSSLGLEMASA